MSRQFLYFAVFLFGFSTQVSAFDFDFGKVIGTLKNAQMATTEIDEPNEIELGSGIASNLLGAAPLLQNQDVQKYVNRIGLWLALQTERPRLPWRFGVLDDDDVNAFAAPGGHVFITKGLLMHMRSEAELAGVLAHEIAHVLRKHHLLAIKQGARSGLLAEFAGHAMQNRGANPALIQLVNTGTELYARGLDKDDELEADRMGVVIATRAGYDPYGLPAVLQTLQGMNAQDASLALMFKTHPALNDRLNLLDQLMSGQFDRYANQPDHAPRFTELMNKADIHPKRNEH